MIAAYNAGPSRAAEWNKVPPGQNQLTGEQFINNIDIPSTRVYVLSILDRYRKLKGHARDVNPQSSASPAR